MDRRDTIFGALAVLLADGALWGLKGNQAMAANQVPLELTAEFVFSDNLLRIDYRITNHADAPYYLLDRFFMSDPSGRRWAWPGGAYVLLEENETVHVTRSAILVPAGLKVEYPEVPYASLLAPGATSMGQIGLQAPLRANDPYHPTAPEKAQPQNFKQVYFSLGVVPAAPDLVAKPMADFAEGTLSIAHRFILPRQVSLRTPTTALTLPVVG